MKFLGWTDCWISPYKHAPLTDEKKRLLIEVIRRRHYSFNYFDHQNLAYGAPYYNDNTVCDLTKSQWDEVMNAVYQDVPRGARLMPVDAIKRKAINEVLYERKNDEPEVGENNE